jgi:hypothetical protein
MGPPSWARGLCAVFLCDVCDLGYACRWWPPGACSFGPCAGHSVVFWEYRGVLVLSYHQQVPQRGARREACVGRFLLHRFLLIDDDWSFLSFMVYHSCFVETLQ